MKLVQEVEKSSVHYLDALDNELRRWAGYKKSVPVTEEKTVIQSSTAPDCVYMDQKRKNGLGYLSEMTVDTKSGIVIGIDCFSANQRESSIILKHIDKIKTDTSVHINTLALDAGYSDRKISATRSVVFCKAKKT